MINLISIINDIEDTIKIIKYRASANADEVDRLENNLFLLKQLAKTNIFNDKSDDVIDNNKIREYCPYKNAPCNYTGKGWHERCVWCKDNNGFVRVDNK